MKRTGITIALICLTATLDAQTHRIDSIKKILSSQTGQKLVNSFNALGNEFSFYWVHSDSSIKYTSLAIREASSIGYNSGKAEALYIRGGVEGRLLGRPAAMEQFAREAIETARGGKDLKVLSLTYYYLGIALSLQGKYPDAEQVFVEARKSAIQAMPPMRQKVFRLSRFEHKTYREISEELSISTKTVENQIGKALRLLRLSLGEHRG